jgi:hypothetical protein
MFFQKTNNINPQLLPLLQLNRSNRLWQILKPLININMLISELLMFKQFPFFLRKSKQRFIPGFPLQLYEIMQNTSTVKSLSLNIRIITIHMQHKTKSSFNLSNDLFNQYSSP